MKLNIHLSTAIHRASDALGQDITAKTIALVRVLAPVLPARLEEVRRGQEGVVTEDSSNSEAVPFSIRQLELLDLISQVSELGLSCRAQVVGGQQTRCAIELHDRKTLDERGKGLEGLGQLRGGSLVGQKASGGGDSEGVQGMREGRRVIMDVGEPLQGSRGRERNLRPSHCGDGRRDPRAGSTKRCVGSRAKDKSALV